MIHMPHRSVTRFFVPLIDVLLLLFCIFLLMPFANEEETDKKLEDAAKIKEEATALSSDMDRQLQSIREMEINKEELKNVAEMREKIAELEKRLRQTPQQRYNIILIDIDKDDGGLSYVDAAGKRRPIRNAKEAGNLIHDNRQEAQKNPLMRDKGLYYFFLYPRPQEGYPVARQVREYKEWFTDAANSLP